MTTDRDHIECPEILLGPCPHFSNNGTHLFRRGGEEGLDYVCDCGAFCPHSWPDDIREEGGGHYCNWCGADGLS